MKHLIFFGLALLLSSGTQASTITRVAIDQKQAEKLEVIQTWLSENLSEDCAERTFYNVLTVDQMPTVLGYEVHAKCVDAPVPVVALAFDLDQNYVETEH